MVSKISVVIGALIAEASGETCCGGCGESSHVYKPVCGLQW